MSADGMREDPDYRDLDIRLATAPAAVEASYTEAQRHLKRLGRGSEGS